jgi:hypothetical protein
MVYMCMENIYYMPICYMRWMPFIKSTQLTAHNRQEIVSPTALRVLYGSNVIVTTRA